MPTVRFLRYTTISSSSIFTVYPTSNNPVSWWHCRRKCLEFWISRFGWALILTLLMFVPPQAAPVWLQTHSVILAGILASLKEWMVSVGQPQDPDGLFDKAMVESKMTRSVLTNILKASTNQTNVQTLLYLTSNSHSLESWIEQCLCFILERGPKMSKWRYQIRNFEIENTSLWSRSLFVMHFWNQTSILWLKKVRDIIGQGF